MNIEDVNEIARRGKRRELRFPLAVKTEIISRCYSLDFSYNSYKNLLTLLKKHHYHIVDYHNWNAVERGVILRHDIDNSLEKAVQLAELERDLDVKSTYFVLVTTDFYNIFSHESKLKLQEIQKLGHEVGLHFDEMNDPEIIGNSEKVCQRILYEKELLENVIESPVTAFSMHRPSKEILAKDIQVPDMINSYSALFFHKFKYLSDSRHHWREPVEEIIQSEKYPFLHILTHAVGYSQEGTSLQEWVEAFLDMARSDRWEILNKNFTDLEAVAPKESQKRRTTQ